MVSCVEPRGYGYSRFCDLHRAREGRPTPTKRHNHIAGETMFVDYAGATVEVVDGTSGEIRQAQILVAVLGASSCTYAEATWSQTLLTGSELTAGPSPTSPACPVRSYSHSATSLEGLGSRWIGMGGRDAFDLLAAIIGMRDPASGLQDGA